VKVFAFRNFSAGQPFAVGRLGEGLMGPNAGNIKKTFARKTKILAESFPDEHHERVVARRGEVGHLNARAIKATCATAYGDHAQSAATGFIDQTTLWRKCIDGINDDAIKTFEDFGWIIAGEEARVLGDLNLRVNGAGTIGHDSGFVESVVPRDGVQLTIRIGDADRVAIDEGEVADAGASEGFDRPRSYATQADDHEVTL
jgi:hypothetical protein